MFENTSVNKNGKKKCVFLTLGFDAGIFLSSIAIHNVLKNDKYIFIVPEDQSERGTLAEQEVLTNINYLKSRGIHIEHEFLRITEEDIWNAVLRIVEKINEHSEYDVFFDLSGGMRCIIIIALLAAITSKNKVKTLVTIQEKKGQRIEIPLFLEMPKTHKIQILKKVANQASTLEQIAHDLNKDESSTSRTINKLVEEKFLERKREGRTYTYTISNLGKLFLLTHDSTSQNYLLNAKNAEKSSCRNTISNR
ncbi:MAG: CRISPR-associated CARF protein Csa3 [Candidatus Jordarchaeum sp.]|uniref:CRISPR-associated CARF protein Csa3 n=1 Tax=Candidatus Jordarchaeum sp. TaxID=2823881 RepID=UPI0040492ABB